VSENTSPSPETEEPVRSPFAGCLIFIVIAVVALSVITFAAYSFKKQTEGFASFSETEEVKTKTAPLTNTEELENKMINLETGILKKAPVEISLSADELNLAIAHFKELEGFRGGLYFESIENELLSGQLHRPFASTKDLPVILCRALSIERRDNFLQSTITASPLLTDGQIFLKIDTLKPSRGEVPPQLVEAISPFLIFPELAEDSRIKKVLSHLTSAKISDDKLIISYSPEKSPPSGKEEADKLAQKARHLVALGAIIFILTMILFFIVLAKRRKSQK